MERSKTRWAGLASVAVIASSAPALEARAVTPRKHNVVIITADAMRSDLLGVNGNREVKTPRLDALAAEGVNFTRAYTSVTTTTPSHASLFSSLYALDHKAYSNTGRVSDSIDMLPERLRDAGWHTAAIVNMRWLNPEISNIPQGVEELARCKRTRKAERTNRWVLDFLDRRKGEAEPFYLWIHYIDTHTPYHAPGELGRRYYPQGRDPRAPAFKSMAAVWPLLPKEQRENEYTKRWLGGITDADYIVASYKGSASLIDARVGDVIDRLKKNGQWDDTLFVFTADHGEAMGEHKVWFDHGGLFEVTARVPLIIRAPGGPSGLQSALVAQHVDVAPTVLARLGMAPLTKARGQDLWPLVQAASPPERAALIEHAGNNQIALVTPRYKYIRHLKTKWTFPGYPFKKGREELYDLAEDPAELKDLAAAKPELLAELRALLDRTKAGQAGFQGGEAKVDDKTLEQLRSLGYIQ